MQLELEPRQHSVSIEGRTTLVSVRMSQIVQMMEENNRELAEEEDKYGYIGGHAQMRQDSIVSQPVIKDTSFRGF